MTSRAFDLLASFRLADGRRWIDAAEPPWQVDDARAVCDLAVRRHYWVRARGESKTTDAAGIALALLVTEAPPSARMFAYAAGQAQALVLHEAVAGFVERTAGLDRLVDVTASAVTCRSSGASLTVEPSTGSTAFGRLPWFAHVDELAEWPDAPNHRRLWSAILSSIGKVPGARLLVTTSAGAPGGPAHERWATAESSEHWRTSLVPGPCPWWSPADVEAAREQLLPAEFARLIESRWVAADDTLATEADVDACTGDYSALEPRPGVRYVMGLDVGLRNDATALVIGHAAAEAGGRTVVVDRVLRWTGTRQRPVSLADVEEAVLALWRRYNRALLVFDYHQAAGTVERLAAQGVVCEEYAFSTGSINKLARRLYTCLRDLAITLPADPALRTELVGVRLVETGPGLVRIDHRAGEHDDQAVAVALVAERLLDRTPSGPARFIPAGAIVPRLAGRHAVPGFVRALTPPHRRGSLIDPANYAKPGAR